MSEITCTLCNHYSRTDEQHERHTQSEKHQHFLKLYNSQATVADLEACLKLAVRYLEHPDVLAITTNMALPGETVIERIHAALKKAGNQ